jgi:hypothetical protein
MVMIPRRKTLHGVGLFPSRIRDFRLEQRGTVIPHPININNEYQGLQEENLHRKTVTKQINYDLRNLLNTYC